MTLDSVWFLRNAYHNCILLFKDLLFNFHLQDIIRFSGTTVVEFYLKVVEIQLICTPTWTWTVFFLYNNLMQSHKIYKHQFSNLDITLGGQLWLEKFIFSTCLKNLYLEKCALFLVALNQKVFWDTSKSFQDVHLNQKSIEFQPASLWNAMTLVTLMGRAWANS